MNCAEVRTLLSALADGEIADDRLREKVRSHMDNCEACRQEYALQLDIKSKLSELEPEEASVFLATREIFEKEFEDISHAYREGRGVHTAIEEISYWRDKGYRFAVDADIDDYFDNVPHDLLLDKLQRLISDEAVLRLFRKWIKAEIYDGERIWTLEKGIPQGSVVSPVLANLFLDELDEVLTGFGKKLVRYADDFLILSKTQAEAEENIELTDMMLDDLKLDLNPLKTKIVSFDAGFKFLGAIFLFDDVYIPEPKKRKKQKLGAFPEPLTLKRYLEMRGASSKGQVARGK